MTEHPRADELTPEQVSELFDSIPGARQGIEEGLEQARRGEGIPLDELTDDHGRRNPPRR